MEWFTKIVEDRIKQAQDDGAFDNLAGRGQPFNFEDDSLIPDDLRLTYKILKNAGCLPVELELRKEIYSLEQLIGAAAEEHVRTDLRRRLNLLKLKLDVRRERFD